MRKRDKSEPEDEGPVDLAARIGSRSSEPPPPPPAEDAAPPAPPVPEPPPPPVEGRPSHIGMDEPPPPRLDLDEGEERSQPIPSPRTPPGPGEMDIVITPLPTLDDWHRFELALRKVRGLGQVRTEYYRHGVLKVRVSYAGGERLAQVLRGGVPGYRVRIIGEDRTTLQILVSNENDDRRPG